MFHPPPLFQLVIENRKLAITLLVFVHVDVFGVDHIIFA